jgi:hypothetical protein
MKKLLLPILMLSSALSTLGQNKVQDKTAKIVEEGKRLYKSEMASWYGTDLYLEKYSNRKDDIGGYFSYSKKDTTTCVLFSKGDAPKVIGTVSFDNNYDLKSAKTQSIQREFTPVELQLYTIRKSALLEINTDTIFKSYQNTELNLIPMIHGKERSVFVLTGPKSLGVIIFGNDYQLKFDSGNRLIEKRRLHKSIIPFYYGKEDSIGAMHTHLPETGEFITSTDICTLMLYEKPAKWKKYYVISQNQVSIWDCDMDNLTIVTRADWDKTNNIK